MPNNGTGHPLTFRCLKLAQTWPRTHHDMARHTETLTGRWKKAPANGKGNPRKSWFSFEYTCTCGHTGWTSHKDVERRFLREFPSKTLSSRR